MIDNDFKVFWFDLFSKPKMFFTKNLTESTNKPRFFVLAFIIFGLGYGINQVDKQIARYELQGTLDNMSFINSWISYWFSAIIVGLLVGMLSYYIGGWFFNVRVKWSKGTNDIVKSRNIFVYSGVISSVVIIFTTIISSLLGDKPYDPYYDSYQWDIIAALLVLISVYYSIYVSYIGVITLMNADKYRSKLWFLILPIIFHTALYLSIILLAIELISL